MKFKTDGCQPGDFIAVPLERGGWAVALVVKVVPYVSRRPPHAMHTYGFGKLFASCPTLEDALKLRITDTVCFDYSSGYQVWAGAWPRLGALPGFRERDWPIPPHAGTAGPRYSERGGRLTVHVMTWTGVTSEVVWDSHEQFIIYDEYSQLPHLKGLGDAAGLSSSLDMAIHDQHPWHYYPVTEERLAIWKRVMDPEADTSAREGCFEGKSTVGEFEGQEENQEALSWCWAGGCSGRKDSARFVQRGEAGEPLGLARRSGEYRRFWATSRGRCFGVCHGRRELS